MFFFQIRKSNTPSHRRVKARAIICSILVGGALVLQPSIKEGALSIPTAVAQDTAPKADFDIFKPNPANKSRFDYTILDEALRKVVLDLGPSTRLRARKVQATAGSRFVRGHKSAYRLEGNRFLFEYISDEYRQGLVDYRLDLQDLGTDYDITKFPKNEQLAFWLNLHNVAVLEKISEDYPVQRPKTMKLKIDGRKYKFDEAPFIQVKGQNISLSDIRKNIVYPNWDNDSVIYGFFKGDIGSPSLQSYAYTGENVMGQLNQNADDFVNSLRGFNLGWKKRNVSALYEEAAPYYFQNWDVGLTAHLLKHANETVQLELANPYPIRIDRYDTMVADVSGGQRLGSSGAKTNCPTNMSCGTARLLREQARKTEYLRRRGIVKNRTGYVIIEDLVPEEDKQPTSP